LEWLIKHQRGGGYFSVSYCGAPYRAVKKGFSDMLQLRFDPLRERAELVKFEKALQTQSSDVNSGWYYNNNERIMCERLLLSNQQRMVVLNQNIDRHINR